MQIIKDKQLIDNTWTFVADDQPLASGDISVSLARWEQDKAALQAHTGRVGVRLSSADDLAAIAGDLTNIALIELDFPVFTDGRLFSKAKLLRDEYGYTGEIRAVGNYMLDQIVYLARVGANAFLLSDESQLPLALNLIDELTVHYQ